MNFLLLRSEVWKDVNMYYRRGSDTLKPFYELTDFMSPSYYPPLGLLYLGAALEHEGYNVEIIDLCKERIPKEHLKNALLSSDAVGMNVYTNDYKSVANISETIKKIDSSIPLIVGGPHCTFLRHRSLYDIPHADISVIGEGERVIIDIARFLQGRKKLSDIHGIYYRENNRIKKGKPLQIVDDLDAIYFPARHLVDKYDYGKINNRYLFKPKFTAMITSRGCPFKCRFCARYGNVIKNWGFRQRSAENVVKEIQEIDENFGSVVIVDDNFLGDKKRAHTIMDSLIEIGTNIELMIEGARVDSADRTLYNKMKKANVKLVGFGIESGNQDVLDFYNKKFTLEQARDTVHLSQEMGFITMATFILGAPIETKKHIENTIKFACSLPIDIAFFGPLYYQMGSPLWVKGVKNNKISNEEYTVMADSRRGLGNFTPEELFEFRDKATRRFYLRPSFLLGQIYRAFLRKNFNLLKYGSKVVNSF